MLYYSCFSQQSFHAVFVIHNLFKGTVQIYVPVLNYMYKLYYSSCKLVTNGQIKSHENVLLWWGFFKCCSNAMPWVMSLWLAFLVSSYIMSWQVDLHISTSVSFQFASVASVHRGGEMEGEGGGGVGARIRIRFEPATQALSSLHVQGPFAIITVTGGVAEKR